MDQTSPYTIDILPTSAGDLKMTLLGHASLYFEFQGSTIYVDPYTKVANYALLPKADLILITHEHMDHFDIPAIELIRTPQTVIILNETSARQLKGGVVMHNGDQQVFNGISIRAVPAYNLVNKRPDGHVFHPRGNGNGYLLTFADQVIYVAGDTENIPEMKGLKGIACAFLPMNLPYTMTPEMAAEAARAIHPRILVPYHFSESFPQKLAELLKDEPGIEVRLQKKD